LIHLGADARLALLDLVLGRAVFGGLTLKLFTDVNGLFDAWFSAADAATTLDDFPPEDGEVESDFVELEGHGYADVNLDPDQWITDPGPPALAVYPKVTWTFNADPAAHVCGYYVLWTDSQRLAWSERFSRPQWVEYKDDNIAVVPTFRLRAIETVGLPPIQDGEGA
jgi:hypothetical protein